MFLYIYICSYIPFYPHFFFIYKPFYVFCLQIVLQVYISYLFVFQVFIYLYICCFLYVFHVYVTLCIYFSCAHSFFVCIYLKVYVIPYICPSVSRILKVYIFFSYMSLYIYEYTSKNYICKYLVFQITFQISNMLADLLLQLTKNTCRFQLGFYRFSI